MKKLLLSFGIFAFAIINLNSQTPQSFNYQAIARDNLGNIIIDQDIGLRISILQGSINGTIVYSESHTPHTNQFGLFDIGIGIGSVLSGSFSAISWGANIYFIKTEMDTAGGTTYTYMGASQLMSVPYALYSENSANVDDADADSTNELQTLSVSGSNLSISRGNTVSLPGGIPSGILGSTLFNNGSSWTSGNNLFNNGSNIGIGTTVPSVTLDVSKSVHSGVLSLFRNTSSGKGSTAIKTEAIYDTRAYLGIQGSDDFDSITGLNLVGDEIGVLGTSLGASDFDNYGIYGYSNGIGVFGKNSSSGRSGHLGGSLYGAYGQRSSDRFGYLGGYYGAYGQYSSDCHGFLGGPLYGVFGRYNTTNYGYLGSSSFGVYAQTSTSGAGVGGFFKNISYYGQSIGVYASAEYTGNSNSYQTYGLYVTSISTTQNQTGIYNFVDHTGSNGSVYGQNNIIDVASGNYSYAYGINVDIDRDDDYDRTFGMYITAYNGTDVYGIFSMASSGSNSTYAGYFNGNLAYTGSLIHISDRKFKENITSIDGSLDKIKKLNTYSFTFKSSDEAESFIFEKGRQFGFIAQELEEFFPELVSDNVHPYTETVMEGDKEIEKGSGIEYKGVNYIGMIPVLTEAIKEQQVIIEDQQQQIDELRLMITKLME